MKYYLTTTIKEVGGSSLCVYVPRAWNVEIGNDVDVTIHKAEGDEDLPPFTYIATIRAANTTNGRKVTIPKVFGLSAGEWITITIEAIGQ